MAGTRTTARLTRATPDRTALPGAGTRIRHPATCPTGNPFALRGFTMIEVMITVAIVAILVSVALPTYNDYFIRANRAAAKTVLLDVANRQQQYFIDARGYAADMTALGVPPTAIPTEVTKYYTITTSGVNTASPPIFSVTGTPLAGTRQAADGALVYNSDGTMTPAAKWK